MHEGTVVELDSPLALLQRESRFKEMCEQCVASPFFLSIARNDESCLAGREIYRA
jgi:hypothetical protein